MFEKKNRNMLEPEKLRDLTIIQVKRSVQRKWLPAKSSSNSSNCSVKSGGYQRAYPGAVMGSVSFWDSGAVPTCCLFQFFCCCRFLLDPFTRCEKLQFEQRMCRRVQKANHEFLWISSSRGQWLCHLKSCKSQHRLRQLLTRMQFVKRFTITRRAVTSSIAI